jgi:hypothetical protein
MASSKLHILWTAPLCILVVPMLVNFFQPLSRFLIQPFFELLAMGVVPVHQQLRATCPFCAANGTLQQHSFDNPENIQHSMEDSANTDIEVVYLTCFNCGRNFTRNASGGEPSLHRALAERMDLITHCRERLHD